MLLAASCSIQQRRIKQLASEQKTVSIALPENDEVEFRELKDSYRPADTLLIVDSDGHQTLIMNAVKDEDGEMVAQDVIKAAVISARFRNVAERHGKIDLEYQIQVPEDMIDKEWQLRFRPRMVILGDTIILGGVHVTGENYRREQGRGYQRYQRFIDSIVTDSTLFIDLGQLELFIQRNIPDLYYYKKDSSYVSDMEFESVFGVDEAEAIEHYTSKFLRNRNDRKKANAGKMFRKYVKSPYVVNLHLDTVVAAGEPFEYNYAQTIETQPKLRKVDILLGGTIYNQDKRLYDMPETEPLTFYISSLASFVSNQERYLSKTIYRQVEENTACYIDFELGKDAVNDTLSNNSSEISRIKGNLASLIDNKEFDLDSIVVTASASPEGSFKTNSQLSLRRSNSVKDYFSRYLRHYTDSLKRSEGMVINFDETFEAEDKTLSASDIKFIPRRVPENWEMLDRLVREDFVLDDGDKEQYFSHAGISDPDAREAAMQRDRQYKYYRQVLYPKVRTVKFDFFLHRKGMVEESILTTVLDSTYMRGVQAIRDRDYETAVTLLRPYNDFNTAVAYSALDYNASALSILETLDKTPEINYMLAVIYSRQGKDQQAVQCYLDACRENPSFVHRGNLDPEISALIKQYGLNRQDEDDLDYGF